MQTLCSTSKSFCMKPRILLIYTGGTIGMMRDPETSVLIPFNFDELLEHVQELKQLDCDIDTEAYSEPIDSSNMDIDSWQHLGDIVNERYDDYEGFVILHGSDTMSYTGSALSFMFENLTKPIILTGSQLPIGDLRTDAKENLITSIQLATAQVEDVPLIREVCIYFEYQLYRANRTHKRSAQQFEAFDSPNYAPLAVSGVNLTINQHLLWQWDVDSIAFAKPACRQAGRTDNIDGQFPDTDNDLRKSQEEAIRQHRMIYRRELVPRVAILKLFPGMPKGYVSAILDNPEIDAVVMETFGSGNAPTSEWFMDLLKQALLTGKKIVNVTQCVSGGVVMGKYLTSVKLKELGLLDGKDMTTEAALAKLMYLLAYCQDAESFTTTFEKSLRGELTEK